MSYSSSDVRVVVLWILTTHISVTWYSLLCSVIGLWCECDECLLLTKWKRVPSFVFNSPVVSWKHVLLLLLLLRKCTYPVTRVIFATMSFGSRRAMAVRGSVKHDFVRYFRLTVLVIWPITTRKILFFITCYLFYIVCSQFFCIVLAFV